MKIIEKINKHKIEKNKEINKILNIKKNYNIDFEKDIAIITNDQNEKILTSEYIFFGIYNTNDKLWAWSSSIAGVNKKQIELVKNIKNKSFMFENDDNETVLLYYQLLTNDIIKLSKNINEQLEKISDLLLYLSDAMVIFKPINSTGNIQFIGLTKIKTKYV